MSDPPNTSSELASISQLLHLTYHRNKNQHRLAKWWKPFSMLRRQVGKLGDGVEVLERAVKFSPAEKMTSGTEGRGGNGRGEGKGESKYVKAARETVEERVEFLERWVVPRCFLAFSNVIADNQYAALGLMLTASLARVQTILKVLGKQRESETGEEVIGDEDGVLVAQPWNAHHIETDLGEVVSREEISESGFEGEGEDGVVEIKTNKGKRGGIGVDEEEKVGEKVGDRDEVKPAKRPKKKRKKGGDAFDDLFAGLI